LKDLKTNRYSSEDKNVEAFLSLTVYIRFQDVSLTIKIQNDDDGTALL